MVLSKTLKCLRRTLLSDDSECSGWPLAECAVDRRPDDVVRGQHCELVAQHYGRRRAEAVDIEALQRVCICHLAAAPEPALALEWLALCTQHQRELGIRLAKSVFSGWLLATVASVDPCAFDDRSEFVDSTERTAKMNRFDL